MGFFEIVAVVALVVAVWNFRNNAKVKSEVAVVKAFLEAKAKAAESVATAEVKKVF